MSKHVFSLTLLLFVCISTFAQQTKKISGSVYDSNTGETLIGVSIVEPGTSNGTLTDMDGKFSLTIKGNTIKVSYVGYKSQEVNIDNGSQQLNVKLFSDNELDEVVVVGYTVMKKRDVLGAVSKVGSKELTAVPASGVSETLQGRIAGVEVASVTGAPGAGVSVRIRGTGSINSGNDPLYIVDGIPIDDGMNSISPSDIENISVLKDASSAAIYGSRANNGVVLITTKQGKSGKPRISYNGQAGVQKHGFLPKMANTSEYINIYNVAAETDDRTLIDGDYLVDFADVNHLKEIFRTALLTTHNVSVTGGKDKITYLASATYYDQDGIIKNSSYDKISGRGNITYQTTKWLKLGLNLAGGKAKTHSVPSSGDGYGNDEGGSVVRYAFMRNPAIPTYNSTGGFIDLPSEYFGASIYDSFFGTGYNPVGVAKMADRVKDEDTFLGKISAEVKLPYSTIWTTNYGIDYYKSNFDVYNATWGSDDRINNPSTRLNTYNKNFGWTFNSVFNNIQTFNEVHNLNTMIGTEAIHYSNKSHNSSTSTSGDTYDSDNTAYSLMSFFGKADYNYNHKYYLSALIREDGSSRFTKGNRWGTFYSFSAGWDVNEEAFLKDVKFINLLKLRAGWGAVGNQNVQLYAYTDQYTQNSNYPFGGTSSSGYYQSRLGNDNLKWETSNQLNLGLDMTFHNGEYGFSVDYYDKRSKDMLVKASFPPSTGDASAYWVNDGEILNRGVDIELFYRKQLKDMGFSATINWGFLKNKVLKLDAPIQAGRVDTGIYAKYIQEGSSTGSYYLYQMDGIFQNEKEIVKSAYQGSTIAPGDVKYKDLNHDGTIDENDRAHVGSSIPKQTLGINLQANYKGWDLTTFFQGAFGQDVFKQIGYETEGFYRGFNVSKKYYDHYWRGEGTSNKYPRPSWSAKSNNVMASTRFLEDASYLRLKNIQLGYTFSLKTKDISSLRVYVNATNLLTFTDYTGLDPEMTTSANSSDEGDIANGIDWGTYPVAKNFTFGVNITF